MRVGLAANTGCCFYAPIQRSRANHNPVRDTDDTCPVSTRLQPFASADSDDRRCPEAVVRCVKGMGLSWWYAVIPSTADKMRKAPSALRASRTMIDIPQITPAYLSSQTSSRRAPLKMLLTITTCPLT